MPRHPMPHQWPAEPGHETSPPGSIVSDSGSGSHRKRERIKEAVEHIFDKFRRPSIHRPSLRNQRARSVDFSTETSTGFSDRRGSKRPKSLIVTSANRPAPIPVTVTSNMRSVSSMSSSSSHIEKSKKSRGIGDDGGSVHSGSDAASQRSATSAVRVVALDGDATLQGYSVVSESDTTEESASVSAPALLSETSKDAAIQTEDTAGDSLGDSIVIIPSQTAQTEPSDTLTELEETIASLSPELPPVHIPDVDVDCLDLDGSDSDSTSDVLATPALQASEFSVPLIVDCTDAGLFREPTVLSPILESASEVETPKSPIAIQLSRPASASPPSAPRPHDSQSPSLAHYIAHIVAPHKDLRHTIDTLRPPLGYSITILCYSLTWWLVTKTPSQIAF